MTFVETTSFFSVEHLTLTLDSIHVGGIFAFNNFIYCNGSIVFLKLNRKSF